MTNFCKRNDMTGPRPVQRKAIRAVISACCMIAASFHPVAQASARDRQGEAHDQAATDRHDPYADFLANYAEWARSIEAEGLERGTPLTAEQLELASQVGIEHPENVRLVVVEAVPFPAEDENMRRIGESLGFIGPGITNNAQAFGYTIWVREGFSLDRPALAHELVHVAQIERSASFAAYVRQYMMELFEYGHLDMPLEVEAYEANRQYE